VQIIFDIFSSGRNYSWEELFMPFRHQTEGIFLLQTPRFSAVRRCFLIRREICAKAAAAATHIDRMSDVHTPLSKKGRHSTLLRIIGYYCKKI
jgi:hypothetical protein